MRDMMTKGITVIALMLMGHNAFAAWSIEDVDGTEPSVVVVDVNNDVTNTTTSISVLVDGGVYSINPYDSPDWIELTAHDGGSEGVLTVLRDGSVALSIEVDPDGNIVTCIGGSSSSGIEADIAAFLAAFASSWGYSTQALAVQSIGMNFVNTGMCSAP